MTDDRKSAIALIAASIGGMLTMAIHPVAGSFPLTPETVARLAVTSAIAHSLAIVSFVALFLGACGLSRRLAAPDRLAFAAVVVFAFGSCGHPDRNLGQRLHCSGHHAPHGSRRPR